MQERTGALGVVHVAADNGATREVGAWDEDTRAWLASCTRQQLSHRNAKGETQQGQATAAL